MLAIIRYTAGRQFGIRALSTSVDKSKKLVKSESRASPQAVEEFNERTKNRNLFIVNSEETICRFYGKNGGLISSFPRIPERFRGWDRKKLLRLAKILGLSGADTKEIVLDRIADHTGVDYGKIVGSLVCETLKEKDMAEKDVIEKNVVEEDMVEKDVVEKDAVGKD